MVDEADLWRERYLRERTARLAAEEVAARSMSTANARVSEAAGNLERTLREQKAHFLAVVSHELRTPVTIVQGGLHVLEREAMSSPTMAQVLGTVRRAANRLTRIVQNVEISARLRDDDNAWPPSLIDFEDLARSVVEQTAPDASIRIQDPDDVQVLASTELLRSALSNLVHNAVTYGRSPISVEARELGDRVEITVVDGGSGLPPDRADLFTAFSQGDHGDRRTSQGLGLGLTVVVDAAIKGGWSVRHFTGPEGAVFAVTVPNAHASDAFGDLDEDAAAPPAGSGGAAPDEVTRAEAFGQATP